MGSFATVDVRDGAAQLVKERSRGFGTVERSGEGIYCLQLEEEGQLRVLTATVDPSVSRPAKGEAAFVMSRLDSDLCGASSAEIDVYALIEGQLKLSDEWGFVAWAFRRRGRMLPRVRSSSLGSDARGAHI